MNFLLDIATPAEVLKYFIQDNLVIVIAGVLAVAAVAAALIIRAIKKKK